MSALAGIEHPGGPALFSHLLRHRNYGLPPEWRAY